MRAAHLSPSSPWVVVAQPSSMETGQTSPRNAGEETGRAGLGGRGRSPAHLGEATSARGFRRSETRVVRKCRWGRLAKELGAAAIASGVGESPGGCNGASALGREKGPGWGGVGRGKVPEVEFSYGEGKRVIPPVAKFSGFQAVGCHPHEGFDPAVVPTFSFGWVPVSPNVRIVGGKLSVSPFLCFVPMAFKTSGCGGVVLPTLFFSRASVSFEQP